LARIDWRMVMDTSKSEHTSESAIASVLQARGLLVAKPYFDQRGADLLGFRHICGGAKFCRIQSKYRQAGSHISIPAHYVPGAFVCIAYVVPKLGSDKDLTKHALYSFLSEDIMQWNLNAGNYVLSLPSFETCTKLFKNSVLDDRNFERLCRLIDESTVQDEMRMLDFSNPNNSGLLAAIL